MNKIKVARDKIRVHRKKKKKKKKKNKIKNKLGKIKEKEGRKIWHRNTGIADERRDVWQPQLKRDTAGSSNTLGIKWVVT